MAIDAMPGVAVEVGDVARARTALDVTREACLWCHQPAGAPPSTVTASRAGSGVVHLQAVVEAGQSGSAPPVRALHEVSRVSKQARV